MKKQKVIFDHDGGVDDLLSLMLLLTMEHIELLAVTITPADCYLSDATESTLKILKMFDRDEVVVGQGKLHGINAFPADWRAQPKVCNAVPDMLIQSFNQEQISRLSAHDLIADLLSQHQDVSVLMTGPCSNLVAAIDQNKQLTKNIKEVIWMGGAVDVQGNVAMHNHNTSAEWNAFWDPIATEKLFQYNLKIKLIALDATNHLPVDIEFLKRLAKLKQFPIANLAGQFWALTINSIPSYEFTYYMWDVLATSYLGVEEGTIVFERSELDVSITEPNAGQTMRSEGSGQWADVAVNVDKDVVLDYVIKQFSR